MKYNMDSIDDRTHSAEKYVKRWEPQEGTPQPKQHDMDALCEAFKHPEMRKRAQWADDGRPLLLELPH